MKYFKFKKRRQGQRTIILREKKNVYDKPKETYISKKGSLMIFGIEASGKSHHLMRLVENIDELWARDEKIIFSATDSLSEILYKNLEESETKQLLTTQPIDASAIEDAEDLIDISKQYIKFEALKEKAKKSVLVIDDLNKVTGKKLELTKDLMRNCKRFVITAKSEDSIHRTLRNIIHRRNMKVATVQLTSKASVDATNILFAMFILGLFIGGLPEVAMLVMAGRLTMKGTQ